MADDFVIEPSSGEVPVIEDGLYTATCRGIEQKTVTGDQFGKNEKLIFTLVLAELVNEDGSAYVFKPQINRAFSEKSNFYKFAVGFGVIKAGSEPRPISSSEFMGRKAQVLIKTEKDGAWPHVETIIPIKANGQGAPVRAQEPNLTPSPDADELSDWWKATREQGLTRDEVMAASKAKFEAQPHEISGEQRAELYLELIGA